MKYLFRFTPWFIVSICLLLFLGFKSPERPWDRIINSDGKGYYAYLPAIFIYKDLRYTFVENYEYQYYPLNRSVFKEFRQQTGENTVNKYFPGMAVIWLPFFLLGHLFAWLEIFPRDGYSLPYQYAIAFSAFFFLWLGARWLLKLLRAFGANDGAASFITIAITLGTNILFFVIVEPSMTHVYSFALITGFLLALFNLFHNYHPKWFVKALLTFVLIFLIRPTNGMILMTIPFVAGNFATIKAAFQRIITDKAALIRGAIQALVLFSVLPVLYYLQTGSPFVYSYGDEKLDLLHPNIFNILFSFNRGWFVYTPLAFLALFGFFGLFRENRFRFYWLLGFFGLFIYVVSCWWVWYYASKCGQRVFIDIYPLIAILLLFLYRWIQSYILQRTLTVIILLLIGLNILQFYQHAKWIFPPYNITREIFLDSFFSLSKKARSFLPEEGISKTRVVKNDMEKDYGIPWMNPGTRMDSVRFSGAWSSRADRKIPYSVGIETRTDTLFTTANRLIRITAWIFAPREKTEATLVADFQLNGKSVSYNQFILEDYLPVNKWTKVEVAWYVPRNFPGEGSVKIYAYNPSLIYALFIDDLAIEFISLKEEADYRKIEGVLMPEEPR